MKIDRLSLGSSSSGTLSVVGHCALHRGSPSFSVIGQNSHVVQVIGVNTKGGRINLALFGCQVVFGLPGVFLIFGGILSALALPGSHLIVSGGVQANLAFSVG